MGTKLKPGAFDCYANAEPDEPMFILLGRDKHAPALVGLWAALREMEKELPEKVGEARECMAAMVEFRKRRQAARPATGEQIHKVWRAALQNGPDGKAEGTRESLAMCATMIDTYAPDLDPANDQGQVSFSRAMMESVAEEIKAFLATLPAEQPREGEPK